MDLPSSLSVEDKEILHGIQLLQSRSTGQFIRWVDINETLFVVDSAGNTLLHWAAACGDLRVVIFLLEEGLDINARNSIGATPMLCAAASSLNPGAMIDCFIRRGANTDVVNMNSESMYSLLEQRKLKSLSTLFQVLRGAMEDSPKLFASSGVDKNGVGFEQREHLGSSEVLAKTNTVRFQRDTLDEAPEGIDAFKHLGGLYPDVDDLPMATKATKVFDSAPSSVGVSPSPSTTEVSPSPRGPTGMEEQISFFWEEERKRLGIISDYWMELAMSSSTIPLPRASRSPSGRRRCTQRVALTVNAVLDERFVDGYLWLLIRKAPLTRGLEEEEEWVRLEEIREDPVVAAYLSRPRGPSDSQGSSMPSGAVHREKLDSLEREELEKELIKIGKRNLNGSLSTNAYTPALISPRQPLIGTPMQKEADQAAPDAQAKKLLQKLPPPNPAPKPASNDILPSKPALPSKGLQDVASTDNAVPKPKGIGASPAKGQGDVPFISNVTFPEKPKKSLPPVSNTVKAAGGKGVFLTRSSLDNFAMEDEAVDELPRPRNMLRKISLPPPPAALDPNAALPANQVDRLVPRGSSESCTPEINILELDGKESRSESPVPPLPKLRRGYCFLTHEERKRYEAMCLGMGLRLRSES